MSYQLYANLWKVWIIKFISGSSEATIHLGVELNMYVCTSVKTFL